jgi:hypothetical protein
MLRCLSFIVCLVLEINVNTPTSTKKSTQEYRQQINVQKIVILRLSRSTGKSTVVRINEKGTKK